MSTDQRVVPHYSAADWYDLTPYHPAAICPRLFVPRKRCRALSRPAGTPPCVCQAIGLALNSGDGPLGERSLFWDHVRAWRYRGRLVITSEPYTPVPDLLEGAARISDQLAEYDAVTYVSDASPWWPGSTNLVYICGAADPIPALLADRGRCLLGKYSRSPQRNP